MNEVSGIPNLIEKDSGGSAPVLAESSILQLPIMSQSPGTQVSVTLKHPEKRLRQRRHSLTTLELFTTLDRVFIVARLSEKIDIRMKVIPY